LQSKSKNQMGEMPLAEKNDRIEEKIGKSKIARK
jgi:hypothetical protein